MKQSKNCGVKGLTKRGMVVAKRARQSKKDGNQSQSEWNFLNYVTEYGKKMGQVS